MLKSVANILSHRQSNNLADAIRSCIGLVDKVIVGVNPKDSFSINTCHREGAVVIEIDDTNNISDMKNRLMSTVKSTWFLWLEPWDKITKNNGNIQQAIGGEPQCYHLQIMQGKMVTKDIRLFHHSIGCKFENPVFEFIDKQSKFLNVVISSDPIDSKWEMDRVKKWLIDRPTDSQAYYSYAHLLLQDKQFDQFIMHADKFLFYKNAGMSAVMTKYHSCIVRLYAKGEIKKVVEDLIWCLSNNILMAEFWCLLGDAYYKIGDTINARYFYENAIILGSQRLSSDLWPIDLMKYSLYPQKMIEICSSTIEGTRAAITIE